MRRKEDILRLLDEGYSYNKIVRELGCSRSVVAYHVKMRGQSRVDRCPGMYDWTAVEAYLADGHSKAEAMKEFGFSRSAWTHAIRKGRLSDKHRVGLIPLEDLTIEARKTVTSRSHLKDRLIKAGLLRNECYICYLTRWCGKPLSLQLDHINGVKNDNRLENLRLLCPNCHSQTETWGGRNVRRRRQLSAVV